jgi:acyl-CoA thioesterase
MTSAFERATTLSADGGGSIDASWYQGRGAFGGIMAALLLRAMREKVAEPERTPRSITVHFCGPATEGPIDVRAEVVRSGSRVSHATARAMRDGETTTFASASFCKSRTGPSYALAKMPEVAPPGGLPEIPRGMPGLPAFFEHVDARFAGPTLPFSASATPEIAAWVRLREPAPVDAAVVALLLDALPPAITATFDAPRAVASVDFTIHFFERLPERAGAPDDFHLVAIRSRWADDGYTEEIRDLWSPSGVLLGQCRQLLALL